MPYFLFASFGTRLKSYGKSPLKGNVINFAKTALKSPLSEETFYFSALKKIRSPTPERGGGQEEGFSSALSE